jgi:flavin reductase (DIM6/NTAB) family NADH-FMN oxidoreductase RutF
MSLPSTAIEAARFRAALGHYASGITVITSHLDGEPLGFTCQSFHSVSTQPPLVSFSVMSSSASYPKIRQAGRFAVNILSAEQITISPGEVRISGRQSNGRNRRWVIRSLPAACTGLIAKFTPNTSRVIT